MPYEIAIVFFILQLNISCNITEKLAPGLTLEPSDGQVVVLSIQQSDMMEAPSAGPGRQELEVWVSVFLCIFSHNAD